MAVTVLILDTQYHVLSHIFGHQVEDALEKLVFCKSPWLCRVCSAARIVVLDGALQVFRQPSSCKETSSGDRVLGMICAQSHQELNLDQNQNCAL